MGGTLLGVHIVALVHTVLEHTVLVQKVLEHKVLVHIGGYMLLHVFLHVHMVYILLLPQALEGRVN